MKRKIIIAIAFIIGITVILRQVGLLDINFYKSWIGTNQRIVTGKRYSNSNKSFSFNLVLKNQDEILAQHLNVDGESSPSVDIECRLEEILYSGNYRLPLYKTFKVKYKCEITTVKSVSNISANGTIEGDINARIIGLCSTKKVRDIIRKEITKSIMKDLPGNLRN